MRTAGRTSGKGTSRWPWTSSGTGATRSAVRSASPAQATNCSSSSARSGVRGAAAAASIASVVPTDAERKGDFSASRDNNGYIYNLIRDASTGLPCTAGNTAGCFQDGGVLGKIPTSRLNSARSRGAQLLPAADVDGGGNHDVQRDQHRQPGQAEAASGDVSRRLPGVQHPATVREDGRAEQLQGGQRPVHAGPVRHRQQRAVQRLQRHGGLGPVDDAVLDHGELLNERDDVSRGLVWLLPERHRDHGDYPREQHQQHAGPGELSEAVSGCRLPRAGFLRLQAADQPWPRRGAVLPRWRVPDSAVVLVRHARGEQPGHHAARLLLHTEPRAQRQLQCDQDRRPPHAQVGCVLRIRLQAAGSEHELSRFGELRRVGDQPARHDVRFRERGDRRLQPVPSRPAATSRASTSTRTSSSICRTTGR